MRVFANSLILAFCFAQGISHAAIGVTIHPGNNSILSTYADNGDVGPEVRTDDPASFSENGITNAVFDGDASATTHYTWTNNGVQAVFEAKATQVDLEGRRVAGSYQQFEFTLTHTVNYLIEGQFTGTSANGANDISLETRLNKLDDNFIVTDLNTPFVLETDDLHYAADHTGPTSFDLKIDGVQQGNSAAYRTEGTLSGQIGPGNYRFYGVVQLDNHGESLESVVGASGFTRLTLTDPNPSTVPEPATIAIWGLGAIGAAFRACRRRLAA